MYTLVVVLRFISLFFFFFFNDTATTEIYTLSLHDALPIYLYSSCVTLLNELEAWAMYFTNALADHQIAFGPCAPVYCSLIVQNYAILLVLRSRPSAGKFPHAVKLFKSWLELLEREQEGLKQGALLNELAKLQAKG